VRFLNFLNIWYSNNSREHNISENKFIFILRWGQIPALFGPLGTNLNQWATHLPRSDADSSKEVKKAVIVTSKVREMAFCSDMATDVSVL
jgi:hypothetical protein